MKKKPSYDWVVCDSDAQEMRYNRCGETRPMSIIEGLKIDTAAALLRAFVSAHKTCKEAGK